MRPRDALWILTGVTLAGGTLRAIGLDSGLWYDEIVTLVESVRPPLRQIVSAFPSNNHHPLYSVLAHGAVTLFGEHAWTVRLPAYAFGVAAIPILYLLGLAVTTRRESLFAAALLAVSYHHIWFSQNARGYTALAFWTMLSTLALWRGLQGEGGTWPIIYALAAGLGLYTHLTMAFTAGAHAIVCGWLRVRPAPQARRDIAWLRLGAAFALGLAVFLVLSAPLLPAMYGFYTSAPSQDAARVGTYQWAFWETLRGLTLGLGMWGVLGAGVLGVLGLWSYYRQSRLLIALMMLPGLLTALAVAALGWPMRPRFFFFLVGFAAMILARGATVAGERVAGRLAFRGHETGSRLGLSLGAALVGCLLMASVLSLPYGYRLPKQDFDGAMRFVDRAREQGDAVATLGPATLPYREYYGRTWYAIERVEQFDALRAQARRVWLVYTFPEYVEASSPDLMSAVRRQCVPVGVFPGTVGGGDIVVCAVTARD